MKRLISWFKAKTLSQGIFRSYILLGALVFLVTVATSIMILYSIEDIFLERMLLRAEQDYKMQNNLSDAIQYYSEKAAPRPLAQYSKDDETIRVEYFDGGKNYHALKVNLQGSRGWLVLDASDHVLISQALREIIGIFLQACLFLALLYWLLAKQLSKQILKPFQTLLKQVEDPKVSLLEVQDIEYLDVKVVAEQLIHNLDEKQRLLEQNFLFNKGVSHELRTPLQVIHNSIEMIRADDKVSANSKSLQRLQNASTQLQQIVLSFLWLSSSEAYNGETDVKACIDRLILRHAKAASSSGIELKVQHHADLSFKVPVEVVEVILNNLLQNAMNHCSAPSNIDIKVDSEGVCIENDSRKKSELSESFGLGISIVKGLTERFDLLLNVHDAGDRFVVKIMNSSQD